jgi:hypothetical protein
MPAPRCSLAVAGAAVTGDMPDSPIFAARLHNDAFVARSPWPCRPWDGFPLINDVASPSLRAGFAGRATPSALADTIPIFPPNLNRPFSRENVFSPSATFMKREPGRHQAFFITTF